MKERREEDGAYITGSTPIQLTRHKTLDTSLLVCPTWTGLFLVPALQPHWTNLVIIRGSGVSFGCCSTSRG
jgi:hypothetical protein